MQDFEENPRQPYFKVATENEMPSGKMLAAAKRDINRGWRRFCEKRGIDPSVVGRENGFKPRRGRPRKEKPSVDDDGDDTELPSPVME